MPNGTELDEGAKTHIKLEVVDKRGARKALRDFKSVVKKSAQPYARRDVACSKCGKVGSRPIAPPGIHLCDDDYFDRVVAQFAKPSERLFLDQNDLHVYHTAVETLGAFGRKLPQDYNTAEGEPIEVVRGAVLHTAAYGKIWHGDAEVRLIEQLSRKLGTPILADGLTEVVELAA